MEERSTNPPEGGANNNPQQRRVLASYTFANARHYGSSILSPNVNANNFELKPQLITLVQNNCSFGGGPLEDPNQHLSTFLRICDTVKSNGVHPDIYKLLLFPFSLRDKAIQWLETFPKESINTWDNLVSKFLAKFYPSQRIIRLKTEVQTFTQMDAENLYEAWERYKALLRKCPPEMFTEWDKLQNFYEGLTLKAQEALDHSAGGSLQLMKTVEEAQNFIDMVANNQYFFAHQRQRQPSQRKGVLELERVDTILAQHKVMQ
ncbi:Retrotransposon gag protein [Arachis hypogaea]|nr:Retrotransposon gag protein [Arachis hypogaea]